MGWLIVLVVLYIEALGNGSEAVVVLFSILAIIGTPLLLGHALGLIMFRR